jgi:hypothetical protein
MRDKGRSAFAFLKQLSNFGYAPLVVFRPERLVREVQSEPGVLTGRVCGGRVARGCEGAKRGLQLKLQR